MLVDCFTTEEKMYAEIPPSLKSEIEYLLSQDKFVEAKKLYAHWHKLKELGHTKKTTEIYQPNAKSYEGTVAA